MNTSVGAIFGSITKITDKIIGDRFGLITVSNDNYYYATGESIQINDNNIHEDRKIRIYLDKFTEFTQYKTIYEEKELIDQFHEVIVYKLFEIFGEVDETIHIFYHVNDGSIYVRNLDKKYKIKLEKTLKK